MEDVRPIDVIGREPDVATRAGGALRAAAERLRSSGVLEREQLAQLRRVPDGLESVGAYLERRRLPGVRLDAERLVVARPVVALLAAAIAGYAAARAVKR
jgi:hypothetical protein